MTLKMRTLFVAILLMFAATGCGDLATLSPEQQSELNSSLAKAGFQATYDCSGESGMTLEDRVESDLQGQSPFQISHIVETFLDNNHIKGYSSIGIQGPSSYVSVDFSN